MAKVISFTYCEDIEQQRTEKGTRANIVGPIGEIKLIGIPSHFTFSIACTIVEIDSTVINTLRSQFIAPNEEILNDTGVFEVPILEDKVGRSLQMNLKFNNLPLKEEGEFRTIIFFNNEKIGEFPITVYKE